MQKAPAGAFCIIFHLLLAITCLKHCCSYLFLVVVEDRFYCTSFMVALSFVAVQSNLDYSNFIYPENKFDINESGLNEGFKQHRKRLRALSVLLESFIK